MMLLNFEFLCCSFHTSENKHYVVVKYQLLVQYTSCFMIEWYWLFGMHATIFIEAYTLFTLHV